MKKTPMDADMPSTMVVTGRLYSVCHQKAVTDGTAIGMKVYDRVSSYHGSAEFGGKFIACVGIADGAVSVDVIVLPFEHNYFVDRNKGNHPAR